MEKMEKKKKKEKKGDLTSTDEIEVTPEMTYAGVMAMFAYENDEMFCSPAGARVGYFQGNVRSLYRSAGTSGPLAT